MPYIGNQPGTGVRSRFIYTATASQTTFSGADDNSKTLKYADSDYIDVYLNGVCLVPGTDYTASTKTSVVLTQAASLNDTLEVVAYDIASMADTVSKADGGTFEGDLGITNASPDLTLTNNTTEDTDGGRESTVTFKGLQSGGEESTLAEIRASHDATADDQKGDLIFKTNDGSDNNAPTERLRIDSDGSITTATLGTANVKLGLNAGKAITSGGTLNTLIGEDAGAAITAGDRNTFVGYQSGTANTTGIYNTFVGSHTGKAHTVGYNNVAIGNDAFGSDVSSRACVAIGSGSLQTMNNTNTDVYNTAVGFSSGAAVTTGANNTLLGSLAGTANTTGSNLTAIGKGALAANTTADNNTAVGTVCLTSNTTGYNNVAIGYNTMGSGTTLSNSTAIGHNCYVSGTTGYNNTVVGHYAFNTATDAHSTSVFGQNALTQGTGSNNAAFGSMAGYNCSTGAENTFLGRLAGYQSTTTGSNNTSIGYYSQGSSATASNEFTLGNSSVSNLRCADTSISSLSDQRDKKNIVDVPLGLDFINTLRPVAFDWERRDGSKKGMKDFGFVAQELKTAQEATDYSDHMRLVNVGEMHTDDGKVEMIEADPMKTYPVLVKAVQELSTALDAALARIKVLEG